MGCGSDETRCAVIFQGANRVSEEDSLHPVARPVEAARYEKQHVCPWFYSLHEETVVVVSEVGYPTRLQGIGVASPRLPLHLLLRAVWLVVLPQTTLPSSFGNWAWGPTVGIWRLGRWGSVGHFSYVLYRCRQERCRLRMPAGTGLLAKTLVIHGNGREHKQQQTLGTLHMLCS